MNITENLNTRISNECDVLVCGGGFAGISAALAAAREGKKVILIERQFELGGLGTAGIVTIYLPLCDGMGRQVSFAIAEELLRLSVSMGAEQNASPLNRKDAANWLKSDDVSKRGEAYPRYEVNYNPHLFAILAEKLLLDEGVKILYGTYAVGAQVSDSKISAVITESKSGRQAIKAASVVDATGDCDIAHFAGATTDTFKQGNILASWYYCFADGNYDLKMLGFCDIPDELKKEGQSVELLNKRRFGGLDAEEISEFVQMSHDSIINNINKERQNYRHFVPINIATIPQLRMTRKLVGEYVLDDSQKHMRFEDSIGMVSDWRKRGPVYEVPFGTLYSAECKNLITAGRCTSVTESMWDIMRVIPCCAVTGQAAGTAAAMTDDFTSLDVKQLQSKLVEAGVVLHESDLN